jgi:uncharacterized protein YxjI
MAAAFCMKCGAAVPPEAQFCAACGAPVTTPQGAPPAPLPSDPPPPPPAAAAPNSVPSPPLAQVLGVQGARKFLLQHLLVGARHSYRVMDHEKRHLFSVGENVREERQALWNNFVHPAQPGQPAVQFHWGAGLQVPPSFWGIEDAAGNLRGRLSLQAENGRMVATLADATGNAQMAVNVVRGMASLTAQAAGPDGRPTLEARGNLMHHNFAIHDAGGAEVAKIHESYVSARDTYNLDLVGNVDPVSATVFAILIDHFKGK